MPRPRIEADDDAPGRKRAPVIEELHEDMCRRDIVTAFEYLRFTDGYGLIKLDRGVRDFLLRMVRLR